jgi:hypothetical protein
VTDSLLFLSVASFRRRISVMFRKVVERFTRALPSVFNSWKPTPPDESMSRRCRSAPRALM